MHSILFLSAWRLYVDVFLSPSFLFLNDCKHVITCMYLHDFMKITHWLLCFSWVANLKLSQSNLLTVKDLLALASNSEKKIDRHLNFPKKNSWQNLFMQCPISLLNAHRGGIQMNRKFHRLHPRPQAWKWILHNNKFMKQNI